MSARTMLAGLGSRQRAAVRLLLSLPGQWVYCDPLVGEKMVRHRLAEAQGEGDDRAYRLRMDLTHEQVLAFQAARIAPGAEVHVRS